MLTPHLSVEQQERYRQFALTPDEMPGVYAHLDECAVCRKKVEDALNKTPAYSSLQADLLLGEWSVPQHLTDTQIAAYVDGALEDVDREIAECHLQSCTQCKEVIREVRVERTILSTYPEEALQPLARLTMREQGLRFFRLPVARFVFQTLLPAIAVVILIGIVLNKRSALRSDSLQLRQQSSQIEALRQKKEAQDYRIALLQRQLRDAQGKTKLLSGAPERDIASQEGNSKAIAQNLIREANGNIAFQIPVRKQDQSVIVAALQKDSLDIPVRDLDALKSRAMGTMMGENDHIKEVELIGPKETRIATTQPVLQWRNVAGALRYKLALSSEQEEILEVELEKNANDWKVTTHDTTGFPPKTTMIQTPIGNQWKIEKGKLLPGERYHWDVAAYSDSFDKTVLIARAKYSARFSVLGKDEITDVEKARAQYAQSNLLLGIYYASRGLIEDARAEWKAQLEYDPSDAQTRRLLEALETKLRGK